MEAKREVAKEIVLVIHVEKLVTLIGIVPNVIQGLTAHPIGKIWSIESLRICRAIVSFTVQCTKGEEGKFCISQFGLLRKVPFEERINLLKENGDCNKCFGDCPPSHCKMTRPWVCGREKEGRGCGKTHELLCWEAKVFLNVISLTVVRNDVSLVSSIEDEYIYIYYSATHTIVYTIFLWNNSGQCITQYIYNTSSNLILV